ncbi:MAG: DUF5818 domain-containing protein [Candidatus Sulfotelmatobacter sp.]
MVCDGPPIAYVLLVAASSFGGLYETGDYPLSDVDFPVGGVSPMLAQDLQGRPSPASPSDILGPQLIAWSQLQKPQPVPQPLPPPDRPISQPAQQTQPTNPPAQEQQPVAQTFKGTIVKDGSRYVLKVPSNTAYQLDDQKKAKQYEGRQVKIGGAPDANGSSLHVISIELVS